MSIFGQNPADITGALFKAKNLADLPDKAAARTNLDVPSKAEVQYNSVPVGTILPYWGSTAPAGYLPCSGQTITSGTFPSLVQFLNPGQSSATVPDLRGEFLRGLDNGRGIDTGRTLGTAQSATIITGQGQANALSVSAANTFTEFNSLWGTETVPSVPTGMDIVASSTGTIQTPVVGNLGYVRPRNIAVLYCIKAYDSISNFTSSINIAGLVSDYSTLNAAAVKYADFIGTNQNTSANGWQKLPGGLILQWGTSTVPASFTTITFPLAFPNACLSFTATALTATVYADVVELISAPTTTGVQLALVSSGSGGSSATIAGTFKWIAIGN